MHIYIQKIIDLANKGETNTVGKSVFSARQKFFADSQLSNVDQLMPRPSTPPGYCYIDRCPSPSFETSNRRHSYSMCSTSQSLSSSPIIAPSPKPANPSLSTTFSLPWERSSKKKELIQPKPQTQMNVIKFLEKHSLVSENVIELPEPVAFKKEVLSIDIPITIQIKNVETLNPMIAKILESLPEPIQINTETLPDDKLISFDIINNKIIKPQLPKKFFFLPDPVKFEKVFLSYDESLETITEFISMPIKHIPRSIHILPEPVNVTREILPQDTLLDINKEFVVTNEKQISKICTILPEPVKVTNILLPQDEPFYVETVNIIPEEKHIPENIKLVIDEVFNERSTLKSDLIKTTYISSLTLESNIEAKKETKKTNYNDLLNGFQSIETEPFNITMNEKQQLLDYDTENINSNITENASINSNSSINEFLSNKGTLYLNDPLPRKSIPTYENNEEQFNLIDLSENDITDKVKNWYNVVDNAINEENSL